MAALAACAAPSAAPLTFDAATVGGPNDVGRVARLFRPAGDAPAPAVVVLHGCSGIGGNTVAWARRLAGWGYVALLVDSFGPRDVRTVCHQERLVTPGVRAGDAFAAAAWLRRQSFVRPTQVGVIGFSHGGSTVMRSIVARVVESDGATPFAAAVAFYPGCRQVGPIDTDTLVLIGDADDWASSARCEAYAASERGGAHTVDVVVYPGARHAFDSPGRERLYEGHHLAPDPAAAADAIRRTREFLAAHLDG